MLFFLFLFLRTVSWKGTENVSSMTSNLDMNFYLRVLERITNEISVIVYPKQHWDEMDFGDVSLGFIGSKLRSDCVQKYQSLPSKDRDLNINSSISRQMIRAAILIHYIALYSHCMITIDSFVPIWFPKEFQEIYLRQSCYIKHNWAV